MIKERQIKKLTTEMKEKIQREIQDGGVIQSFLEGRIKEIERKYKPKIEELERDRRYILDKLPFIRG